MRILVHVAAWVPLLWLGWSYWQGQFIVDPIREMTTITGKTALILLMLSLACTPISTLFGLRQVVRVRRALGLYAFLYASVHGLVFLGLDFGFDLDLILRTILDQRYVLVGLAAVLLLLPLALTSTRGWQRRLGKGWKRLHRMVYVIGILAVAHFLLLAKDPTEPWRYGLLLALLLIARIPRVRRAASASRYRLGKWWKQKTAAPSLQTPLS